MRAKVQGRFMQTRLIQIRHDFAKKIRKKRSNTFLPDLVYSHSRNEKYEYVQENRIK